VALGLDGQVLRKHLIRIAIHFLRREWNLNCLFFFRAQAPGYLSPFLSALKKVKGGGKRST
jgi:hypothetical protein